MNPREVDFLRRLVAGRFAERRGEGLAARMAEQQGLGVVRGAKVLYTDADFTHAADLLCNRSFALSAPPAPFPRSQAPDGGSEKTGALPVTHGRVAVVAVGLAPALVTPPGSFLAMHWQDALALPYEVLLVCENLEPLLLLHEYRWLADFYQGRPTLALFRGAPGLFGTDAATKLIAADARPTLAFFDFDPKGLSMAASLPRREALCLPAWPELEAATRRAQRQRLFTQSAQVSRVHLDRMQDSEIALAWQRLRLLTLGLNQEGFPR
ncbi:hypothetical protein RCH06_002759 [Polaromonas sp. CG_9.5]|uniref:DUF7281 domain-containing protein n=1 Tax=Polaromonas sp. CG_9.5 TaxID=3071705 RepID=UPI002E030C18|nr:hypothetical protein [Polaromonas sp. CG_9.5]